MRLFIACSLAVFLSSPVRAQIPDNFHNGFRFEAGFTNEERALLTEAMSVFYERFLNDKILECLNKSFEAAEGFTSINPTYWNVYIPLLEEEAGKPFKNPDEIRWTYFQNLTMQQAILINENYKLPEIRLKPYFASGNDDLAFSVAKVYQDKENLVYPLAQSCKGAKRFNIEINRDYLGREDRPYSTKEYWAGVIAHEALHLMGHKHNKVKTSEDRTFQRYGMVLFQSCLEKDGGYDFGDEVSKFRCSGMR